MSTLETQYKQYQIKNPHSALMFEEWKKKIVMKETSHIVLDYFTPRFAYDPEDKDKKLGDYRDVDLEDMDEQN